MPDYITDDLETSFNDSDEENSYEENSVEENFNEENQVQNAFSFYI